MNIQEEQEPQPTGIRCPDCSGDGWYVDHSDYHYLDNSITCEEAGCPVQRQCDRCKATGWIQ